MGSQRAHKAGEKNVKKEIYECDTCGTHKKETNNWWVAITGETFDVVPFGQPFVLPSNIKDTDVLHICGQDCLIKVLSRWLSETQTSSM